MQHFANFGYVKQANKQLERLNDIKGTWYTGKKQGLGNLANDTLKPNTWEPETAQKIVNNSLSDKRVFKKLDNLDDNYLIKPILRKKEERLDFSPTTQQLESVLNKTYPEYKGYVNHPKDLLITGSANHTWLTNDGKYMEMPIGNKEMPLSSNMWKGRKSGVRLPDVEINMKGMVGSPVRGINGSLLAGKVNSEDLRSRLIQQSNNYNSQIHNKRYIPTE